MGGRRKEGQYQVGGVEASYRRVIIFGQIYCPAVEKHRGWHVVLRRTVRARRQVRDEFVDKALHAAGIPVFHFIAKREYSVQDIRRALPEMEVLKK
jgi:hypothetical protein